MLTPSLLIAGASAVASCLLTYVIWKLALARGLLDIPNERSSHKVPTPRGGGLAIVLVSTAAFVALAALQRLDGRLLAALAGGVLVGGGRLVDDRRPLSAAARLAGHAGGAL